MLDVGARKDELAVYCLVCYPEACSETRFMRGICHASAALRHLTVSHVQFSNSLSGESG